MITPSDCSWASAIVVVKKADGVWRLCTDYRKLNSSTESDPFPLPRIDELLDKIAKAKFLTKVDMAKGYYQVSMDKESVPLTGFFRWKVHALWFEKCSCYIHCISTGIVVRHRNILYCVFG